MVKASKPDDVVAAPPKEDATTPSTPKARSIELPASLSVRQLAELLHVTPIEVIKQLMRSGIMANINDVVDYEMASTVSSAYGLEAHPQPRPTQKSTKAEAKKRLLAQAPSTLKLRPPVVTVMGHVDHGKTRLLDAIRQTHVMESEAGGITQHIGAYQVSVNNQKITFLDTPGHEAFTAMRAHGAQITDITVLVVAADDGVMPQTLEAIDHARAAGVPIVVAINKIDKPGANADRVKQQLAEAGLVVEGWGGDTVAVEVSAKEKKGIPELLESLLLVAEMQELKANPSGPATGVVIEARMDKTKGPLATVLIQSGTLKPTDIVVVGTTWGRVRAMFDDRGARLKKAEPATPLELLGLNEVPQVGDILTAVKDEHEALALVQKRKVEAEKKAAAGKGLSLTNLYDQISAGHVKELRVILKTDVQGSVEPIKTSLERLTTEKVQLRMIRSGTGNISESDVMLAAASRGLIIGFGVTADEGARHLAAAEGVDIRLYNIIYNLVDDVDKALKGMLEPTYVEVIEGRAEVRAVFSAAKHAKVAGVLVTEGKVSRSTPVRIVRQGKEIFRTTVSSMRRYKDDVKEAAAGLEVGIGVKDFNDFLVGDILEFVSKRKAA